MVRLSNVAKFVGLSVAISLAIATVNAAPALPNLSHLQFKRGDDGKDNDVGILNFALTLEHLEAEFYREGLAKFGIHDFKQIAKHDPEGALRAFQFLGKSEAVHVTTLETVIKSLGGEPVPPCEYNFGISDIKTFAVIARALEQTGVSAYTGALAKIQTAAIQTAGGTIGTVEARHSTFLNSINGGEPIAYPFDTPLEAREVISIAAPFIKKCPYEIPFHSNPSIRVVNNKSFRPNDTIRIESSVFKDQDMDHGLSCAFLYNNKFVVRPLSKCDIPATVRGYTYLIVIEGDQKLDEKTQDKIKAGPVLIFVDDLGFNKGGKKGGHDGGKKGGDDGGKKGGHDGGKKSGHDSSMQHDGDSSMKHKSEDSSKGEDSSEGHSSEGDSSEGDSSEGDSSEGDSSEGDSSEGDSSEGDSSEGDHA